MNPLNFIKDDVKSDVDYIKNWDKEKSEKAAALIKDAFNPKNIKEDMQRNWIFLLLIVAALLSGFFLGAKYYQNECNEIIYKEYVEPNLLEERIKAEENQSTFGSFSVLHPSIPISPTPQSKKENKY